MSGLTRENKLQVVKLTHQLINAVTSPMQPLQTPSTKRRLYLTLELLYLLSLGLSFNIPRALQGLTSHYPYLVLVAASHQLASVKDKQHMTGEQESRPLVGAPATQELGLGRKGH